MLKLFAVRPEWTEQDSAELRQVLNGPLGQRFFNSLMFSRPEVTGIDPEVRRIRSDERAGYEACISEMLALSNPTDLTDKDRSSQTN